MGYTVGRVAAVAGVTVRTLHHYDKAGLLAPSDRSPAGYRRYTDADLARLQQILFYRELGFPLDEIAEILADPQANALDHLRARQRQLTREISRLQRLTEVAERAIEVQQTGVVLMPEARFEVFGEITFDLSYAVDAQRKWGDSKGHREAMARAGAHSKEDRRRLMAEAATWRTDLLSAFEDGEPADGERDMDIAETHRLHVTRWFVPCPPAMHRRIADDITADPRAFAPFVVHDRHRRGDRRRGDRRHGSAPAVGHHRAPRVAPDAGVGDTEPGRISPAHRAHGRLRPDRDRSPIAGAGG
ncbi:MerR family transcriptional regulator [Streptomyces virginiae]|uniref:MerR family transcriptional regulator n=1 Tax=Streptomyces virginiae TaxID=1961 RepID=UPI002259BDCA|nr:MerR family transcriptional regulator [Streptomyces virginiae]MCX4960257.1 MerR family transcriptional regulator [Streptomyces virginiae]